MAFGICRAKNLKMADIQSTDKHNARLYSSAEEFPPNINPEKHFSSVYIRQDEEDYRYPNTPYLDEDDLSSSLQEEVQFRLDKNQVKSIRKNSNVAIEYVLGVSDLKAWDNYNPDIFLSDAAKWIEERHGENSVVSISKHFDETNPHVHVIVVPLITKKVKYKNKYKEGEKIETRLNTREFTGGREKLRQLQQDYFEFCKSKQDKLGIEFYRGTLVENQTKEYAKQTDYRIGKVRSKINRFETDLTHLYEHVRKSIEKRLKLLKSHLYELIQVRDVTLAELEQENKRNRDRKGHNKWKTRARSPGIVDIDPNQPKYPRHNGFKDSERREKKRNSGMGGM